MPQLIAIDPSATRGNYKHNFNKVIGSCHLGTVLYDRTQRHLEELQDIRSGFSGYYALLAVVMGVQLALGMGILYVLQREGALGRPEDAPEMEPEGTPQPESEWKA